MKKEYGFTLAELLAVIVILGVITAITVPVVTTQIDNYKTKLCVTQYDNILNAARAYGADHLTELDADNTITLSDLNSGGYIDAEDLEDPVTKQPIKSNLSIKIIRMGKKYNYYIEDNGEIGCKDDFDGIYDSTEIYQGIGSDNYEIGDTVTYLGKTWLVMDDKGTSTQLVMNGYLSADELKNNLPDGVETSQLSSNKMRLCLHKNYGKSISDYSTVRDAFVASAGSYCYNIWNGEGNEYRKYTWNTSIVKHTIENWLNSKMTEQGLTKDKELVTMTFNDGVSNLTGYVRIPTYDDVEAVGSYNTIIDNTNYMYTEYDYLIMTANGTDTKQSKVYNYFYGSSTVAGVTLGNSAFQGRVRPIITVRER